MHGVNPAFNRRVAKLRDGVLERGWLYKDQLNPVAEVDASGNIIAECIYGAQTPVPAMMIRDGRAYRLLTDQVGSVRLVVDVQSGEVMQQLDYDAWGRVIQDTNPGFQPFGFAGGLYDHETGLVRFGARDYDPEIGRWTAKDPIRFAADQHNLYVYANNDPINLIDPTGKDACQNNYGTCVLLSLNLTLTCLGVSAVSPAGGAACTALTLLPPANQCFEEAQQSGSCNNQCKLPTKYFGFR
ncbi:MAG: RHS repeat-associated core domain-containing protein [Candidatus Dadabacteria bacterium]|nr:MAG: RHS repeat-associated core domain-containing protein [Candidatus Dadabacteria bacterium]